jgi:hypothetical protein
VQDRATKKENRKKTQRSTNTLRKKRRRIGEKTAIRRRGSRKVTLTVTVRMW